MHLEILKPRFKNKRLWLKLGEYSQMTKLLPEKIGDPLVFTEGFTWFFRASMNFLLNTNCGIEGCFFKSPIQLLD